MRRREGERHQSKLMQVHGKANGHAGRIGMKTKRVGPRAAMPCLRLMHPWQTEVQEIRLGGLIWSAKVRCRGN